MILNCAIIDEDPEALQLLEQYREKTPTLHLIVAYKSAIDAVDGIHHNHLDILFLAIHMQQMCSMLVVLAISQAMILIRLWQVSRLAFRSALVLSIMV